MKALVFNTPHQPVDLMKVPTPTPSEGEVLVSLKAASLNHRDVWMTQGLYPVAEAGVVHGSCGAGTVGDREVVINPNINWGADPNYPDHDHYEILGMPTNGTFAEYIAVNEDRLADKPSHLNWEEAAALPLAGLTAYRALFTKGAFSEGDRVLINGVGGGVALMACQFAIAAGADVFVTSSSVDKIQSAVHLGAKGGVNYLADNWDKAFVEDYGRVDVVIDSAGGEGFDALLGVCNPQARIVVYGGTRGKAYFLPRKLFWKEIQIKGSTMGNDQEFQEMVSFVNTHKIRPVIDSVYPLEEAASAYQKMEEGKQFGKIVFKL